jgi:hypothetical protein
LIILLILVLVIETLITKLKYHPFFQMLFSVGQYIDLFMRKATISRVKHSFIPCF